MKKLVYIFDFYNGIGFISVEILICIICTQQRRQQAKQWQLIIVGLVHNSTCSLQLRAITPVYVALPREVLVFCVHTGWLCLQGGIYFIKLRDFCYNIISSSVLKSVLICLLPQINHMFFLLLSLFFWWTHLLINLSEINC